MIYQLTVVPNNSPAATLLAFRTEDAATTAMRNIKERQELAHNGDEYAHITMRDDFGYILSMNAKHVSYVMFVNIYEAQALQLERELVAKRGLLALQEKYKNDPEALMLLNGGTVPVNPRQFMPGSRA